ncbi:hypothetical protein M23134_08355 [Microscilla marina ATCC 23134]|uniref:FlgD Ig-like domain-containing protein n=2 Tax=Microscilla marina TaxID=1027 RepID=A1ZQN1_MICM2|nr:hypothetical protein M23134_08355 [Microscilla marina ATCC 23134]
MSQNATAGIFRWAAAPADFSDHANVNNYGSIGHLLSISQPGDEVYIGHPGNYNITTPLIMKEGVTLRGMIAGITISFGVSALSPNDQHVLVVQGNHVTVRGITFDGKHRAKNIVYNDPNLDNYHLLLHSCTFKSTRNTVTDGDILLLKKMHNLQINNCNIYDGSAFGIVAVRSRDVLIKQTYVADVRVHGIYIPGAQRVTIDGCTITRTGMDGITGYHSSDIWNRRDFVIVNNHIHHVGWHGMHVSGEGIYIRANNIHDVRLTSIYVGDQYHLEDSHEITIWDNRLQKGHIDVPHFKPDPDNLSWMPAIEVNYWNQGSSYIFESWDSSKDLIIGRNTFYYSGKPCHLINSPSSVVQNIHINVNNPVPGGTSARTTASLPTSVNKPVTTVKVYPNPVTNLTTIEFSLVKPAKVSLSIIDQSGRIIKTLANEQVLNKGNRHITWDATNNNGSKVSNGYYIYQIRVDNQVKTGRLLVKR